MAEFKNDQEVLAQIDALKQMIVTERKRERNLKLRYQALTQVPQVGQSSPITLRDNLEQILPPNLVPSNVGALDSVAWPFWYQFDFDFGQNPTMFVQSTRQSQSIQVSQEGGFLLLAIARDSYDNSQAGSLGPWTINHIRDRQSTRQFNSEPISFQTIGNRTNPTYLATPLFFFPNAFIDIEMGSFAPISYVAQGEGKHQISLFGYRVRLGDEQKIMSLIFG